MYSHSRISMFKMCPKKFEYKYRRKLTPSTEDGKLFLGKMVHRGVELRSVQKMIEEIDESGYLSIFSIPKISHYWVNIILRITA